MPHHSMRGRSSWIKGRIFCILGLLPFFSCTEKASPYKAPVVIDILDDDHRTLRFTTLDSLFVFDSASTVLLGYNLLVRSDSADIFILDKENPKYIYRFDKNGRLQNYIGSTGRLLGDIPSLNSFILHEGKIEILSAYGDRSRIFRYNREGLRIAQEEVNVLAQSFERMGNGSYFFYDSYNFPHDEWRLREVENGAVVHTYLKNDYKGIKYPVSENNFFKFESRSVLFFESFSPHIFRITSANKPAIEYTIDAGKYSVPVDFWERHIIDAFEELMSKGFYNIFNIFENERYVLIDLQFQKGDGTLKSLQVIVNKETGDIRKCVADVTHHDVFSFPLILTNDNLIGYFMNPAKLLESLKKGDLTYLKNDRKLSPAWGVYDNPVIGFVSLD